MIFTWNEDLNTGVSDIDSQHQELFGRINNLLDACSRTNGDSEIGQYLGFLYEYVAFHFAAEEREMVASSFPGRAEHEQEHEQFKKSVSDLRRQHASQGANTSVVLRTIRSSGEWLVDHIMKTDKQLAAFLNKAR